MRSLHSIMLILAKRFTKTTRFNYLFIFLLERQGPQRLPTWKWSRSAVPCMQWLGRVVNTHLCQLASMNYNNVWSPHSKSKFICLSVCMSKRPADRSRFAIAIGSIVLCTWIKLKEPPLISEKRLLTEITCKLSYGVSWMFDLFVNDKETNFRF